MELPMGDIKVSGNDAVLHEHVEKMKQYVSGKIYVLCGLQGSGKGSAAKYISSMLGMLHISTGDLFRDEVKKGTEIGMIIGEFMATGQYVPPEFANSILSSRLKQPDTQCGVLLDGFPRSIEHLLDLDEILAPLDLKVECVFYIDVPELECFRRLTGRRCCPTCQSIFHVSFHKEETCNICHGILEQRKDDSEEVIKRRLALSKSTMGPLLDELKCRDLLYSLNCCDSPSIAATSSKIIEVMCYPCRFLTPRCQSAYARLALHMQHMMGIGTTGNAATDDVRLPSPNMAEIVRKFRDNSLVENGLKRTGVLRKFVYLSSANVDKLAEFVRVFDRYGVEVLQMPPVPENATQWSPAVYELIRCLLSDKSPGLVPVAVLRETSALLKPSISGSEPVCEDIIPAMMSAANRSTLRTGVNANHASVLHAWFLKRENDDVAVKLGTYVHSTKGRIVAAPSGLQSVLFPVFGWDDRFVLLSTGKTYQEHREDGLKISSRDMTISAFLADKIYYRELKNLKHSPPELSRPVDMSVDVAEFVAQQALYNSPEAVSYGLRGMLNQVLNEGIFFKGADTRLEANYWQPGLNAGIPLTQKRDPIHELTFMFHDFGHFLMKDLIFTGQDSPLHRAVYVIHRMMSEAITIMLADGVFVDSMRKAGVDYDFSARKIYPLVCAVGFNGSCEDFVASLRRICKASVDYTLKGDDSTFRQLLSTSGQSCDVLVAFEEKYKPFFVSDFQWTVHNYENMASRAEEMRGWWKLTERAREQLDLKLQTIDEFIAINRLHEVQSFQGGSGDDHPLGGLIDTMFDIVFSSNIASVFSRPEAISLDPFPVRQRRGLLRYVIGQMGIFSRFKSLPEADVYHDRINTLLVENASIEHIRESYEEFLKLLLDKNIISRDDMHNYKETYPLFEPFYVTYDGDSIVYPDLRSVSCQLLTMNAHRDHQYAMSETFLGRAMTVKEKRFYSRMATLIESCHGQIEDGLFVTTPGITLIAHTVQCDNDATLSRPSPDMLHASFLLSGIAVETSLEFIAHSEASVARLTSSKTQAMNTPFFRIQGENLRGYKSLLQSMQAVRQSYDGRVQCKDKLSACVEFFNMTLPACKATALVYTMSIADFNKLFIGRMGESGNEAEVRQVVSEMATILHAMYPDYIGSPRDYLEISNGKKYDAQATMSAKVNGRLCADRAVQLYSTRLSPVARTLFRAMGIPAYEGDAGQLSEFCSRITYLAFADADCHNITSCGRPYLTKMVKEFRHLSIVSATRATLAVRADSPDIAQAMCEQVRRLGGKVETAEESCLLLITMNLKGYHCLLKSSAHKNFSPMAFKLCEALQTDYSFIIDSPAEYELVG